MNYIKIYFPPLQFIRCNFMLFFPLFSWPEKFLYSFSPVVVPFVCVLLCIYICVNLCTNVRSSKNDNLVLTHLCFFFQMEDEGNHGNDDTRCFILSTLAALHTSRVACVLCQSPMLVFDRYPLVDGTFFLSPRQHSKCCLEVRWIVITSRDMLNQHDWFWYLLLWAQVTL